MDTATAREENGEFSVTLGPVTRTVGMLTWLHALVANYAGHQANLYTSLIGFHPRQLTVLQGMSSLALDLGLFLFYKPIVMQSCCSCKHLTISFYTYYMGT